MPTATPTGAAVSLCSVSKTYRLGTQLVTALNDVTIAFRAGTFTAVMGPSGSGKSTLLHCAAGLDRPDRGQVVVAGADLGRLSECQLTRLRRDRVGVVFQSFNLVPTLSAAQNVALPLRLAGRRPAAADATGGAACSVRSSRWPPASGCWLRPPW